MFENTDFNAQGLYSAIHTLFPDITCYAGDEQIGPKGFIPVSITEFCNLGDLTGAAVTAYFNDCEGGPFEIEMSREEQAAFVDDVLHSVVTGKVSAACTTGGFRDYFFSKGDQTLGRIAIYDGLLYCSDGMYSFEREAP